MMEDKEKKRVEFLLGFLKVARSFINLLLQGELALLEQKRK